MKRILFSVFLIGCVAAFAGSLYDSRDGKKYSTIKIGEQNWMAENLNYAASGSFCYDNDESNCGSYGRLYPWNVAMQLSASYNNRTSIKDIQVEHQGVCPEGWHIPSTQEWYELKEYVSSEIEDEGAGTVLKVGYSWTSYENIPKGTNRFGFAALPAGFMSGSGFFSMNNYAYFWSSTEDVDFVTRSYGWSTGYLHRGFFKTPELKGSAFSVRCVENKGLEYADVDYGYLEDERDGQIYKTVTINGLEWMAENLNYATGRSWCLWSDPKNCERYGQLYTWSDAMNFSSSYDEQSASYYIDYQHQGVCPDGWHIPSPKEFDALVEFADSGDEVWSGLLLRKQVGWNDGEGVFQGTDEVGFGVLPSSAGVGGYFWCSAEAAYRESYGAISMGIREDNQGFERYWERKKYGRSVRCVRN